MSTATITPTLLTELQVCATPEIFTTNEGKFVVVETSEEHRKLFREALDNSPDWAMTWDTHQATFQKSATYRCLECGEEHEEYRQNPRDLPWAKQCVCAGPAIRRTTFPGESVALNAKRFEPILVYERPDGTYTDPNHKYYWPGRNDDPPPPDCPNAKAIWLDCAGGLPQIDRFVNKVNAREQEMQDVHDGMRHNEFTRRQNLNRRQLFEQLRARGLSGENAEMIIRDREGRVDKNTVMQQFEAVARAQGIGFDMKKAEEQYERTQRNRHNPTYRPRQVVQFDIPVVSFDFSNRMDHRDPERHGWGKGRRG